MRIGCLVKIRHIPTDSTFTLFVDGHSVSEAHDAAMEMWRRVVGRELKGVGTTEEIEKKPEDSNLMRRVYVVSVVRAEVKDD